MSTVVDGVRPIRRGKVWLVGAGPGDPELLTVRAHRLLAGASVVAYDELVPPEILAIAPASAERIAVGRRARGCRHHEAHIHPLVVERALEGKEVVRLKGGDPFVFGRGGEEAEELAAARRAIRGRTGNLRGPGRCCGRAHPAHPPRVRGECEPHYGSCRARRAGCLSERAAGGNARLLYGPRPARTDLPGARRERAVGGDADGGPLARDARRIAHGDRNACQHRVPCS